MGSRDHSIECEVCGTWWGGINDFECNCPQGRPTLASAITELDRLRTLVPTPEEREALAWVKRDVEHDGETDAGEQEYGEWIRLLSGYFARLLAAARRTP